MIIQVLCIGPTLSHAVSLQNNPNKPNKPTQKHTKNNPSSPSSPNNPKKKRGGNQFEVLRTGFSSVLSTPISLTAPPSSPEEEGEITGGEDEREGRGRGLNGSHGANINNLSSHLPCYDHVIIIGMTL